MSKQNVDAMLDYFELYRQKKKEHQDIVEEIARMRNAMEKQKSESQKLASEIRSMKKIITTMIDQDMDPVEVKLRNDIPSMLDSLWEDHDSLHADEVTLSIAGATGAVGATSTMAWPGTISAISTTYPTTVPYIGGTITGSKYSLTNTGTV